VPKRTGWGERGETAKGGGNGEGNIRVGGLGDWQKGTRGGAGGNPKLAFAGGRLRGRGAAWFPYEGKGLGVRVVSGHKWVRDGGFVPVLVPSGKTVCQGQSG